MSRGVWDRETLAAYKAMREYQKAFLRYKKAVPTVEGSKQSLELAKQLLERALKNPVVERHINLVLNSCPDEPHKVIVHEEELEMELNLSHNFGLKKRQTRRVFQSESLPQPEKNDPKSASELLERIEKLHQSLTSEMEAARQISERIPKKKRKRQIALGVTSFIFASGCAIANAFSSPALPGMFASYFTALTSLELAIRNIVGENS